MFKFSNIVYPLFEKCAFWVKLDQAKGIDRDILVFTFLIAVVQVSLITSMEKGSKSISKLRQETTLSCVHWEYLLLERESSTALTKFLLNDIKQCFAFFGNPFLATLFWLVLQHGIWLLSMVLNHRMDYHLIPLGFVFHEKNINLTVAASLKSKFLITNIWCFPRLNLNPGQCKNLVTSTWALIVFTVTPQIEGGYFKPINL